MDDIPLYITFLILFDPLPPISTLFPYTTLFRSPRSARPRGGRNQERRHHAPRGEDGVPRHGPPRDPRLHPVEGEDRKSTRLNSSHLVISYAVFCLKKKTNNIILGLHKVLYLIRY